MMRFLRYAGVAGLAGVALSASGLAATAANAAPTTVYVSPTGTAEAGGSSCSTATFSSIQAAVEAAPLHGTVVVCAGVYQTSVTVDRDATTCAPTQMT